jgi:hypothetical protein
MDRVVSLFVGTAGNQISNFVQQLIEPNKENNHLGEKRSTGGRMRGHFGLEI